MHELNFRPIRMFMIGNRKFLPYFYILEALNIELPTYTRSHLEGKRLLLIQPTEN